MPCRGRTSRLTSMAVPARSTRQARPPPPTMSEHEKRLRSGGIETVDCRVLAGGPPRARRRPLQRPRKRSLARVCRGSDRGTSPHAVGRPGGAESQGRVVFTEKPARRTPHSRSSDSPTMTRTGGRFEEDTSERHAHGPGTDTGDATLLGGHGRANCGCNDVQRAPHRIFHRGPSARGADTATSRSTRRPAKGHSKPTSSTTETRRASRRPIPSPW